jgi:hypothetical protein
MTRRQNRIGESMALLPDGDTGSSILGETRLRIDIASCKASQVDATPHQNDTATKRN